ncbi:MAG: catechol 2,3-dioxygenase [Solirubrobacteraceae bacterium]|jgi:catechol 2,3-dioxygenase|nr:catechol 2,3-dioxygenase [Solirubrobacteraceae bacterium]MEA2277263.1 catechol 2,3-dioxygenase [Solirubrobacteraceae bacterium]MEA2394231.1 catechol 2,3-dioxygenase [Solirubrobacteraceae bacterium]
MSEYQEPIHDVAQLAHVEVLTPKPDETLSFFRDLLGMHVTEQVGQSVYLRAYEESYHHSLKLTESAEPGLGHVSWRAQSPQALARRVEALEASGQGRGWNDGDRGHGTAYEFTTPDGHLMEILWEVDYAEIPQELRSRLINRPQQRPLSGVPVRRIDHVNLLASDVTVNKTFMTDALGFRDRENIIVGDVEVGVWQSVSPLVHEVAIMRDETGTPGRFHHVAYWYGTPQHVADCAEVLREREITIEAGPGKHGISQALFMYVYEPGGNRVELFGDCGYLIFDPTWKPVTWTEENLEAGIVWYGGGLPAEFFTYGTPIVEMPAPAPEPEPAVPA